jgi:two-component system, NtrC family, response regulator HydG
MISETLGDLDDRAIGHEKPSTQAILDRFHVDLANGAVWLDDRRVLVLQAEWFFDLRKELITSLGGERTRSVLTRLGHAAGVRDALTSMKMHPDYSVLNLISTGGDFHALQGSAFAEPVTFEVDLASKHFYGEFLWRNTIEDAASTHEGGDASGEACWMEIGYASGFMSTCVGGEIIVREIVCSSQGGQECRCVARFAHEWDDASQDRKYLDSGQIAEVDDSKPATLFSVPARSGAAFAGSSTGDNAAPLIGRSAAFERTLMAARRVSNTIATVLLLGESGVGKTALARLIHCRSDRAGKPFVEVNCAAIPESLLESELFGVEKGAFTSATNSRVGRFEEATGGTLFLDEVGLLTSAAQGKLLRVLQSQQFERLGSSRTRQADVRLVAATNNDLFAAVRDGSFRADLFYRLNVFPITVPPLRNRLGDLPLLIDHLVSRLCERYAKTPKGITPEAYRAMLNHNWPGNIRELENVLERAVILMDDDETMDLHHLFTNDVDFRRSGLHWLDKSGKLVSAAMEASRAESWVDLAIEQPNHSLQEIEQAVVMAALRACDGNVLKTARHLGITRAQIDYRLKKWGIDPDLFGASVS